MSDLRIQTLVLGMLSTNCYIIYREGESQAVLIDPADNAPRIIETCRRLGLRPETILLTHGHFDHMGAVSDLRRAFPGIQVLACEKEERLLEDPGANLSGQFGTGYGIRADRLVRDGEELKFLGLSWKVMETPGHTPGSVSFYLEAEDVLFSGDTLFCESFGRTDFPGGSTRSLVESVKKLTELPEDTMVYSGHGEPTTIGHEKQYNPIMAYCR